MPHVEEAQQRGEIDAELDARQVAEWIARSLFSLVSVRALTFDVSDPAAVEAYARTFIVGGIHGAAPTPSARRRLPK